ncbi:MAG TPA: histidine kinase [Thermoanaerobaculia bacterium]|nr:histidine kinase [Thermoanaerobaculia bacterium]
MHPLLADRKRLALYLLAWLLLAFLLALLVREPSRTSLLDAVLFTIPPTLVYAFICITAWFPARALPLTAARAASLLIAHVLGALVWSGVWLLLFRVWQYVLQVDAIGGHASLIIVTGALLYLLSVAFHYLLLAIDDARRLEMREMQVQVLAREAELKTLKAQLDPHFLFNALHSISALCGTSPSSARTLTTLLAEYLRKSLRIGGAESITIAEELELALNYLAVERIRFGPRLEFAHDVDEGVRALRIPPLLLLPLVENAVTHGIAHLVEGGTIQMEAKREGDRVRVSVENRCDADRPASSGHGIGLTNTRRRIETFYAEAARMEIKNEAERYRVTLWLPAHE